MLIIGSFQWSISLDSSLRPTASMPTQVLALLNHFFLAGDRLKPPSPPARGHRDPFHHPGKQKQGKNRSWCPCPCRKGFHCCQLFLYLCLLQLMPWRLCFHPAPSFPAQACQEREKKVLGNSLWNRACEARVYQSNEAVCASMHVSTLPSHQREEWKWVSKGWPRSPLPYFSAHTCVHAHARTHLPILRN